MDNGLLFHARKLFGIVLLSCVHLFAIYVPVCYHFPYQFFTPRTPLIPNNHHYPISRLPVAVTLQTALIAAPKS
jgi:hypothetical protein